MGTSPKRGIRWTRYTPTHPSTRRIAGVAAGKRTKHKQTNTHKHTINEQSGYGRKAGGECPLPSATSCIHSVVAKFRTGLIGVSVQPASMTCCMSYVGVSADIYAHVSRQNQGERSDPDRAGKPRCPDTPLRKRRRRQKTYASGRLHISYPLKIGKIAIIKMKQCVTTESDIPGSRIAQANNRNNALLLRCC